MDSIIKLNILKAPHLIYRMSIFQDYKSPTLKANTLQHPIIVLHIVFLEMIIHHRSDYEEN